MSDFKLISFLIVHRNSLYCLKNLGIFLSVTTNIDSSLFGLNPDPFEQKFGGTPSSDFDFPGDTNPVAESSSYFVTLKNAIFRLGIKFGYYKKPQPHPDVLHDFHDGEEYYEFTCMTADDQPILVNNEPVTVSQPEDCSKYFPAGESAGHASSLQPPPYFTEVAKDIFKSKFKCSVPLNLTPSNQI